MSKDSGTTQVEPNAGGTDGTGADTAGTDTTGTGEARYRARHLLDESLASSARVAPPQHQPSPDADPRSGGDAARAPRSLTDAERDWSDLDSSGVAWDDPEEL
jgi:hypothetical protein